MTNSATGVIQENDQIHKTSTKIDRGSVTQITYAKGGRCRSRLCVVVGALCCGWTVLCEGVDGTGLIAILILRRLSGLQELQKN